MARRPLVAGNWKMNGDRAGVDRLVRGILAGLAQGGGVEVMVCPSYVHIPQVAELTRGTPLAVGAQDLSEYDSGAYTGEVSGAMLAEFGCGSVIVGHSERRHLFGESDDRVAEKFAAALRHGLTPVLCVGETLEERRAGSTEQVIARQLDAVIGHVGVPALAGAVIAYEPVWAIGTGQTATPDQAQAVHAFIRERIGGRDPGLAGEVRILYGGSVKPDNAGSLFGMADIDGGLIGGASLDADAFLAIVRSAGQE
ncbi:MAG: triose-phosphate isomerase [Gammaproteobacteria bacterium]|nr:MAG: triose-phosphate isomerase [Gammaproteobacteria bacterium]